MSVLETATTKPAQPSLRRTLIRSALQYSVGTTLGMVASIARIAITAHFLSPEANGIWLGLQLLNSYGSNLHCGAVYGMFRTVPLLRARNDHDGAERVKRTTLGFVLATSVLGSVVLALVALHIGTAKPRHVLATVVLVAVNLLRSHYTSVFKGESRFAENSVAIGLGSFVAILALPLIATHHLDGVLAGMIAQAVVETAWLARRDGFRIGFEARILFDQLKTGIVTLATTFAVMLLTSVDRTVMLQRCGAKATGAYYIGANFSVLMPALAAIPFAVLTPRFFERAGRGEDLLPLAAPPMRLASYAFAVIVGMGALAIPPAVGLFWPQLTDGNEAARIALFGTFPLVLASFMSNVYYALNRQIPHLVILLASSALGFGLATLGVNLGGGITGAALGAVGAMYVYLVLCVFGAHLVAAWKLANGARLLVTALAPIAYVFGLVFVLDTMLGRFFPGTSVLRCAIAELVLLAAMSPYIRSAFRIFRGPVAQR